MLIVARLLEAKTRLLNLGIPSLTNSYAADSSTRHRWTPEEITLLLEKYNEWALNTGPGKIFRLKEFILSLRTAFPRLAEVNDESFYNRLKRVLYRGLVQNNVSWKHSGRKSLKTIANLPPDLKQLVSQLEDNGIGIATDGTVLIAFTLAPFTGQDDGYEVKDTVAAIAHLNKVAANPDPRFAEIKDQAKTASGLLRQFNNLWGKKMPASVYTPPQDTKLKEGYKITPDATKPNLFQVAKEDGTVYVVDSEEHTCTCPAGQAGRPCKHLRHVLYQK